MDQTASLADTLLKTQPLISNLLSQMSGMLSDEEGLSNQFSALISQNGDLQSTPAQITPQPPTTQTPIQNLGSAANGSSSAPAANDAAASTFEQNLSSLTATLRKVMALLRQQKHEMHTAAKGGKAAQTQDPTAAPNNQTATTVPSVSTGSVSNTANAADISVATTVPGSNPAQTLADILKEIQLLAQLVTKDLKQTQSSSGGTGSASNEAISSATASGGISDASSPADALSQLMAALQKTAQALTADLDNTAQNAVNTGKDVATKATAANLLASLSALKMTQGETPSSALTTQLAALDTSLKNVAAALQPQTSSVAALKTAMTPPSSTASAPATTEANAGAVASPANLSVPVAPKEAEPKPLSSLPAAALPVNVSSTHIDAPSLNTAALIAAAEKNAGTTSNDAGQDTSTSGNPFFAAPALDNASGLTAGGAQATGTYNFASTLSALRAVNGGLTGLPTAVDQVILQMNRSVKNGQDQMSIQLQPGDLGKITIKLDFGQDGAVKGTVTADNPQTLAMLQKDSRSLERALQDAGLRADPGSLQFNLGSQNGHNAGQTAQNNNANGSMGNGTVSASNGDETSELTEIGALSETYYITPNGVNIQV